MEIAVPADLLLAPRRRQRRSTLSAKRRRKPRSGGTRRQHRAPWRTTPSALRSSRPTPNGAARRISCSWAGCKNSPTPSGVGPRAAPSYRHSLARGDALAHAFFLRDRAWSELPYLARWLAAGPSLPKPDKGFASWVDFCDEVIERTHRLGVELDSYLEVSLGTEPPAERLESVKRSAALVDHGREALQKLFNDSVETHKDLRAGDVKNLREVRDLLSVPLLTGNRRNVLWNAYRQIAGRAIDVAAGSVPDAQTLRDSRHFSAGQFYNRTHPSLALIDHTYLVKRLEDLDAQPKDAGDPPADQPLPQGESLERLAIDQLVLQGTQLRQSLRTLRDEVTGWLTRAAAADPENLRPAIAVARTGLSWADRSVRAAMSLVPLPL